MRYSLKTFNESVLRTSFLSNDFKITQIQQSRKPLRVEIERSNKSVSIQIRISNSRFRREPHELLFSPARKRGLLLERLVLEEHALNWNLLEFSPFTLDASVKKSSGEDEESDEDAEDERE